MLYADEARHLLDAARSFVEEGVSCISVAECLELYIICSYQMCDGEQPILDRGQFSDLCSTLAENSAALEPIQGAMRFSMEDIKLGRPSTWQVDFHYAVLAFEIEQERKRNSHGNA